MNSPPTQPSLRSRAPGRLASFARWGVLLLIAASFLQHSCMSSYLVSGNSMLPNYVSGDRVVVTRMPKAFQRPERGDTVIARVNGEILIKRVMGVPGDRLAIGNGRLLEGGEFLADPVPVPFRRMNDMAPITLGEDQYFLMGDHRRVSIDSREFGPVNGDDILGRVVLRIAAPR